VLKGAQVSCVQQSWAKKVGVHQYMVADAAFARARLNCNPQNHLLCSQFLLAAVLSGTALFSVMQNAGPVSSDYLSTSVPFSEKQGILLAYSLAAFLFSACVSVVLCALRPPYFSVLLELFSAAALLASGIVWMIWFSESDFSPSLCTAGMAAKQCSTTQTLVSLLW